MNTDPSAIKVLCYGDSNTYGRNPSDGSRYDASKRWTGLLQKNLGDSFYVIEEGLGGRTTNVDENGESTKNGFTYFKPAILSHEPNIIVVMLGTNDVKDVFDRTPNDIASAIEQYIKYQQEVLPEAKLVIVSPSGVDVGAPNFQKYANYFSDKSVEKAEQLPAEILKLSEIYRIAFVDASKIVMLGEEGLHWTQESHERFASVIADKIREEM